MTCSIPFASCAETDPSARAPAIRSATNASRGQPSLNTSLRRCLWVVDQVHEPPVGFRISSDRWTSQQHVDLRRQSADSLHSVGQIERSMTGTIPLPARRASALRATARSMSVSPRVCSSFAEWRPDRSLRQPDRWPTSLTIGSLLRRGLRPLEPPRLKTALQSPSSDGSCQ